MKQHKLFFFAALTVLYTACGRVATQQSTDTVNDSILSIREQGSFLIGGSVKTQPGTYDTRQPLKPDGQTLHGDHAYVAYQIPVNARKIPLSFCTERDNPPRRGKARQTVVKDSPPCFYVVASALT